MRPRAGAGVTATAVAAGAVAVACCAGLPAIVAIFGSVTLAAVLGLAGGLFAAIALAGGAILTIWARRRGSCRPTDERHGS